MKTERFSALISWFSRSNFIGKRYWSLLLGLMLRAMEEIFAHPQAGTGALALHLYFVQGLAVTFEGSLAQYWGGIVQSFLLYGLAMAVLASTANRRR